MWSAALARLSVGIGFLPSLVEMEALDRQNRMSAKSPFEVQQKVDVVGGGEAVVNPFDE